MHYQMLRNTNANVWQFHILLALRGIPEPYTRHLLTMRNMWFLVDVYSLPAFSKHPRITVISDIP